jgi:hypothetical protein
MMLWDLQDMSKPCFLTEPHWKVILLTGNMFTEYHGGVVTVCLYSGNLAPGTLSYLSDP